MGTITSIHSKRRRVVMSKKSVEGIVVKVTNEQVVLLCQDGTFQNVPRNTEASPPLIGERYTHIEKKISWLKYTSIASVFLLAFITYLLIPFGDASSTYVVAIDINPSIELTVNDVMTVTETSANNAEGEALLREIDMKEQPLAFAIESIITYSEDAGYLIDEKFITTSIIPFNGKKNSLIDEIEQLIEASVNKPDIDLIVQRTDKQLYEEAKQSNLSVNHYSAMKQLETEGVVKNVEEAKGKSMAELRKMQREDIQQNNHNDNNGKGVEQRDANRPAGVGRPNDGEKGTPPDHAEGKGRDKDLPPQAERKGPNRDLPPQAEGRGSNKDLPSQAEGRGNDRGVPSHVDGEKRGNSTPGTPPAHSQGQQNKERANENRGNAQERAPQSQGNRP